VSTFGNGLRSFENVLNCKGHAHHTRMGRGALQGSWDFVRIMFDTQMDKVTQRAAERARAFEHAIVQAHASVRVRACSLRQRMGITSRLHVQFLHSKCSAPKSS
jgi:hypothetical protein